MYPDYYLKVKTIEARELILNKNNLYQFLRNSKNSQYKNLSTKYN